MFILMLVVGIVGKGLVGKGSLHVKRLVTRSSDKMVLLGYVARVSKFWG